MTASETTPLLYAFQTRTESKSDAPLFFIPDEKKGEKISKNSPSCLNPQCIVYSTIKKKKMVTVTFLLKGRSHGPLVSTFF